MYEVFPRSKNNKARNLAALLFIVAVVAMYISTLPWLPLRSVVQLLAVGLIALGLLIMGRYVFSGYAYAIEQSDDGTYELVVAEIKRRSRITVCRISTSDIVCVKRLKREEKETVAELIKGRKVFDYRVEISPSEYCFILADDCPEDIAIKLSLDEKLVEILSKITK